MIKEKTIIEKREKLKILVVDDQSGMRETLSDILQDAGYTVEAAVDGYCAVKKAGKQFFDIILMDVIMPGMNGVEAIKEIKKMHTRTKFILMTAYSAETLINEALKLGIYQYINKPFPPEQIISLLESISKNKLKNDG